MKVFIGVALCFLGIQSVCAQDTIMLEGGILNDTIDKSNLNVVNLSLRKGTTTSGSGVFVIPAREGDTIHISAVQYEMKEFVVNKTMYARKKITLYMEPKIRELQEVTISNRNLTGNLGRDISTISLTKQLTAGDLGIPENRRAPMTPEERKLYGATGGAGAVGALINAISGRTKMLKKHLAVSKLVSTVERNRNKFSDSIFTKDLNIPLELIDDFVYYIFEDNEAVEYVNTENHIELLEFMMKNSDVYLALKEAEKGPKPQKKQ